MSPTDTTGTETLETQPHVQDHLVEYALGNLPAQLVTLVEDHLPGCVACSRELAEVDIAMSSLALALPRPRMPAALRERIFESLDRSTRFERFVDRFAHLVDLAAGKARDLLARIDDAASWERGPGSALVIHLAGGPATVTANVGFVRLKPGERFPAHRHLGLELGLILQGKLVEQDGTVFLPGALVVHEGGTSHYFSAGGPAGGEDLVFAVVLEGGLELEDETAGDAAL